MQQGDIAQVRKATMLTHVHACGHGTCGTPSMETLGAARFRARWEARGRLRVQPQLHVHSSGLHMHACTRCSTRHNAASAWQPPPPQRAQLQAQGTRIHPSNHPHARNVLYCTGVLVYRSMHCWPRHCWPALRMHASGGGVAARGPSDMTSCDHQACHVSKGSPAKHMWRVLAQRAPCPVSKHACR